MNTVLALITLLAVTLTAWRLARSAAPGNRLAEWVVWGATLFFGTSFLLGGAAIIAGAPWLNMGSLAAAAALTLSAIITSQWFAGIDDSSAAALQAPMEELRAIRHESSLPVFLVLMLAAITLLGVVIMSLFDYPMGFEAGAYHIPLGLEYFRAGNLQSYAASGDVADASFAFSYPANTSIWYGFLLQWLPEKLAGLGQLPFLLVLIPTIYGISRNLGADRPGAAISATALLSVPMIAFGALELGADLSGLAFVGLALYLLTTQRGQSPRNLLVAGLATGLAFGFKSLHINNIAILGLLTLWLAWRQQWSHASGNWVTPVLRVGAIFVAGTMLTASFWVLRNWLQHDNPLYPVHLGPLFDALGFTRAWDYHFGGVSHSEFEWVRATWQWPLYPWQEWHFIDQNFKATAGTGAYVAALVLPAMLLGMLRIFSRQRQHLLAPLLLGAALVILLWVLQDVRQPRYALAILLFGLPLSAWLIGNALGSARRTLEVASAVAISVMLFVIASKQLVAFGDRHVYSGLTERHAFYDYPAVLDKLPNGAVVVNLAARPWNYKLYGAGLRNRLVPTQEARGRIVVANNADPEDLGQPFEVILSAAELARRNATHAFIIGEATLHSDRCGSFEEIDRLDRNPRNGHPLKAPRLVFAIEGCDKSVIRITANATGTDH